MFRRRRPRLKALSINKMIPNILTLLALCAGLTAIRFATHGHWEWAVFAIVLASIFDGLDGRVARMLGGGTKFGAELDSLSDFLCFGVAPAMLLYLWTMQAAGGLGWALVLLYGVCCALRLARFNTRLGESDLPPWAFNYFTGLAAPAAAGLVLVPMMLSFELGRGVTNHPVLNGVVIVATAFLMVSRVPTYSFKKVKVPQKFVLPFLLLIGVLAAALASSPWLTVSAVILVYIASIPFSIRSFRALRLEAERLQGRDEEGEEVAVAVEVEDREETDEEEEEGERAAG